jgi:hypothetical protein
MLGESRLRKAIADRQRARLEKTSPELVAAEAQFRKLGNATTDTLIRHLVNQRRGLAWTQDRNGVMTITPDERGTAVRRRTAAMI